MNLLWNFCQVFLKTKNNAYNKSSKNILPFYVVAIKKDKVGHITTENHAIWRLVESELIPFSKSELHLSPRQLKFLKRQRLMIKELLQVWTREPSKLWTRYISFILKNMEVCESLLRVFLISDTRLLLFVHIRLNKQSAETCFIPLCRP